MQANPFLYLLTMSGFSEFSQFLTHHSSDVVLASLKHLLSFSESYATEIFQAGLFPHIISLLSHDNVEIIHNALSILINLSSDADLQSHLSPSISVLIEMVVSGNYTSFLPLVFMLLSNLTVSEDCCRSLMQENTPLEGSFLIRLLIELARPVQDPTNDQIAFAASVLANLSRLKSATDFIMRKHPSLLNHIISQLSSPSIRRRGGCISALRNLLFDDSSHFGLLADPQDKLWNAIKNRLEPTNSLESDAFIRKSLVDCWYLLSSTEDVIKILLGFNSIDLASTLKTFLEDSLSSTVGQDIDDVKETIVTLDKIIQRLDEHNFVDVHVRELPDENITV
ncbi:hypothetical protein RCL1_007091 [Eukaryota sp. TZLM3-RCL]